MVDQQHEAACEKKIRDTFPTVAAWNTSSRFVASKGSDLAADDLDWSPFPFTDAVRIELDLAAEQLHQVQVMLMAGEISLTSQRVLVRTALIAGSVALWMISPDDRQERRRRHRQFVEQNHFRHEQALADQVALETKTGIVQPNLVTMHAHITKRLAEIKKKRAAAGDKATWNDTEIISTAAKYAFRNEPDPTALSNEATFEFRVTSGTAHALPWALFNSPGMTAVTQVDAAGRAVMTAAPLWGDLANSYLAAFYVSKAAWKLLAVRGR